MRPVRPNHSAGWPWVGGALALCLALRLFYGFVYSDAVQPGRLGGDAADYFQIAWTLAQTGEYGRPVLDDATKRRLTSGFVVPLASGTQNGRPADVIVNPDGWRPPGWPVVLALTLKLTGSLTGAFVARFVVDAFALWMLACLLPRFELGRWGTRCVLVLAATHPTWLIYSASMLSEALTLAWLVATLWTGMRLVERPGVGRAVLAGLCAAALVLTHPFQVFTAGLLIAIFIHYLGVPSMSMGRGRVSVALLMAFLVPVCGWVLRNQVALGQAGLTTSSGNVLAMGWSDQFLSMYDNATAEMNLPKGDAAEYLRSNWREVPAVLLRKAVGALGPFIETPRGGVLEAGRAFWWLLGSVAFWLAVLVPSVRPPQRGAVLFAVYLGYLAMAMLTYPSIRFRAPLTPVELILVVAVVGAIAQQLGRRRGELQAAVRWRSSR